MLLRGYQAGDLDAMYALDVVCFEKPFCFTRGAMRRFAEVKKATVVIAEEDGVLAGFVILHREETEEGCIGYIVTLDVAHELRRRGVAGALVSEVERKARMGGCIALALHVFVRNEDAILFYANAGFARSHKTVGFYGPGVDAWVYRKLLPLLHDTFGEATRLR